MWKAPGEPVACGVRSLDSMGHPRAFHARAIGPGCLDPLPAKAGRRGGKRLSEPESMMSIPKGDPRPSRSRIAGCPWQGQTHTTFSGLQRFGVRSRPVMSPPHSGGLQAHRPEARNHPSLHLRLPPVRNWRTRFARPCFAREARHGGTEKRPDPSSCAAHPSGIAPGNSPVTLPDYGVSVNQNVFSNPTRLSTTLLEPLASKSTQIVVPIMSSYSK